MVSGNPSVVVQDMFRKTPESFNAVDMVLAAVGQGLRVIQAIVFAPALERIVASKGIGVIDRSLSGVLPDMSHQFIGRNPFHYFGVDPAVALQKAQNNAFPGCTSAAFAFPPAAEVGIVNLDLALQFSRFKLGHMVGRFTQALVDAGNGLVIST